MVFETREIQKVELNKVILIEGLPGMGNVGKISVDFMIDSLKAKKFIDIYSDSFPHSVFVNEKNLVELPKISLYYKKLKKQDFIFLAGDVQPIDEKSSYELCNLILSVFKKHKGKEIITIGGIGMPKVPKNPVTYCTANNQDIVKKYKTKELNEKIFGTVGPIMGVTGLLVGLASKENIPAIALLSQTLNHPSYLGIKGANGVLKILDKKLDLKLNLKDLDEEIKEIEKEIKIKTKTIQKIKTIEKEEISNKSYIG